MRFAVVGGGISGLAAAWELAGGAEDAETVVYEPARLGGKLKTTDFEGHPVDEGPDSFLTRSPEALELCRQLGLGDELVAPAARQALLYSGGRLRPLPDGLVLGVPARVLPVARSGILSVPGMARALLDFVLPRAQTGDDVGAFELVASRFGHEVAERLVEPLLGSIHAGTTKGLSAAATAPQLLAASRSGRSLLLGLHRMAGQQALSARMTNTAPAGALFMAPRSGMQALTDELVSQLAGRKTTFNGLGVTGLGRDGDAVVTQPDGQRYGGVVLAVPAPVAAGLIGPLMGLGTDEGDPTGLASVRYASVALATLAVEAEQVPASPGLSGILVAPGSGMLMTACSFGSHKWPHWSGAGTEVLRISVGKAGDEAWAALDDGSLVERLCADLSKAFSTRGRRQPALSPGAWRVSRWPSSFPQYEVGHLHRVAAWRAALRGTGARVALAGAAYEGAGVPACIASGRRAAAEVRSAVLAAS